MREKDDTMTNAALGLKKSIEIEKLFGPPKIKKTLGPLKVEVGS